MPPKGDKPGRLPDDATIRGHLDDGLSRAQIARMYGVTKSAVSRRKIDYEEQIPREIVLKRANKLLRRELDAADQLSHINEATLGLLDMLQTALIGEGPEADEAQAKMAAKLLPGQAIQDSRALLLKCCQEIRGQVHLQLEIVRALADMHAVAAFQDLLIDVLGQVDPEARRQFMDRLEDLRRQRISITPPRRV